MLTVEEIFANKRIEEIAQAFERSSAMPPNVAAAYIRTFMTQVVLTEPVVIENCRFINCRFVDYHGDEYQIIP